MFEKDLEALNGQINILLMGFHEKYGVMPHGEFVDDGVILEAGAVGIV